SGCPFANHTIPGPNDCGRHAVSGPSQIVGAVNSRNAGSFELLFCARDFRALSACAVPGVGRLRRLFDALSPGSSLVAYRFPDLGNSDGTASLAMSPDA